MTTALVLGAGGTVGMAHHAGAPRAPEGVGGLRPDEADLVVGRELRPSQEDLRAFGGLNMMRREGNDRVTRVAYESAARQRSTGCARDVLDGIRASVSV